MWLYFKIKDLADEIANPANFEHSDFGNEFRLRQKHKPGNFSRTSHKEKFVRELQHPVLNMHGVVKTHCQNNEEWHQKFKRDFRAEAW